MSNNNQQGTQHQEGMHQQDRLYQIHAEQVKIKNDPAHGMEVLETHTYHAAMKQKQPTGQPFETTQHQENQSLKDKSTFEHKNLSDDKQFQSSELSKKGIQTPSHEASHRLSSQEKHGESMQKLEKSQDKSSHGVQFQTIPKEKSHEKQYYVTEPQEKIPPLQKQENVHVLKAQEKEYHLPIQNKEKESHQLVLQEKEHKFESQEKKVPLLQSQEKTHLQSQEKQLYGQKTSEKQPPAPQQKLSHESMGHEKLSQEKSDQKTFVHEKLGYERIGKDTMDHGKKDNVDHAKLDQQKLSQEKFSEKAYKPQEIQSQFHSQPQQQSQPQGLVFTQVYQAQLAPQTNISQGTQLPAMQMLQGMNPKDMGMGMGMGISNLSTSNTWIQPLPDAKGTIIGKSNFDREAAKEDAMTLFRAMNGAGTNKAAIVEISAKRTFAQRQMIKKEYLLMDDKGSRDLLQDMKSELGGDMERIILPLYMMPGEFDARLIEKALYGIRNDVDLLIEVLCTRTNKEIEDMKKAWTEKIDSKQKLEERVGIETKKMIGLTNFHILCLKILEGKRPPCQKPDEKQVRVDAEELNHKLVNSTDINDAKAKFVEIFTERSWAHIGAVVGEFQKISQKYTMDSAIVHEFGESSNTTKALRVIAEFCFQPYDFWAKKLRDAMKGLGTDDSTLIRIIVTRCEVDLTNIAQIFGHRYGDGKTLKSWIESDTSGDYCQLLLYLCGYY